MLRRFLNAVDQGGGLQGSSWHLPLLEQELENSKTMAVTGESGQVIALLVYRDTPVAREIVYVATHPGHRGKGHMKRLLQRIISSSPLPVWLEVHEANQAAAALYHTLGFEQVGRRANYYRDGGAAILYSLDLGL